MLDDKTGTLSDHFFRFLLECEGKKAMRYEHFFSLLTVEMDQVKGDELLTTLAVLIQQSIRHTDLIGRIDHQRFSVILHHAEAQHTYGVGERIRELVKNYNFALKNSRGRRTVSVGGACFPTHTADSQDLLLTANRMLQRAKSAGGNRVYLPEI